VKFPKAVLAAALDRENVNAGVVVGLATEVVKRGDSVPAENVVTLPPPPPPPIAVGTPLLQTYRVPVLYTDHKGIPEKHVAGGGAGTTLGFCAKAAIGAIISKARTIFLMSTPVIIGPSAPCRGSGARK